MKYPILFLVLFLALQSCKPKAELPLPSNKSSGCLTLAAPAQRSTIGLYGTTFKWSGCSYSSYQLTASYNSDHSSPFIDATVFADSFMYGAVSQEYFSGGRTVYWKAVGDNDEAQGIFHTPDYSLSFAGAYTVEVKKYDYEFGQYIGGYLHGSAYYSRSSG